MLSRRNVPNALTSVRVLLAVAFFVLLTRWSRVAWNAAFVVFLVAALTDVLDGYLARRMEVTSAFGRVADPFVDKLLICGAFIMLLAYPHLTAFLRPWMVVVIVARELLVTAVRSFAESHHRVFAATAVGKIKMFVQSVAVGAMVLGTANGYIGKPWTRGSFWESTCRILVYTSVIVTIASGLLYMGKLYAALKEGPNA